LELAVLLKFALSFLQRSRQKPSRFASSHLRHLFFFNIILFQYKIDPNNLIILFSSLKSTFLCDSHHERRERKVAEDESRWWDDGSMKSLKKKLYVSCCREWWKMKNEYVKLIKFFRFY
jgi:hypothetical protein